MGVRVWGVVDDRLVELVARPGDRFQIMGLPPGYGRTTADRVRAALVNDGLLDEVPLAFVHLEPPISGGPTCELDLAIAMALLVVAGVIDPSVTPWLLAVGRLGLDGAILAADLPQPMTVADVARSMSLP